MSLNMDQLEKQLDKEEFQEIGSIAAFKVLASQFQMFIKSQIYLDDEYVVITRNYFLQYTQLEIPEFHDTLIHHMESMQIIEEKVNTCKALDASLVNTTSSGTESVEQDTSSRSGNDAYANDTDIRPIYDEEPMAETTNRNKPVEQISVAKKPERHIPKGHMSSIKKTSVVHEKTMTPRSCLKWQPTGKIFKVIGLRWVPTGKIFTSSTTKVDSDPINGSNKDITNQYECEQTLDVSAGTLNLSAAMTSDHNSSELRIYDHNNEPSSSKLVPKVVPPADKTTTSRQELELLFHYHITMLRLYYGGGIPFQLKSNSLPHAHAQTAKTYYKHQDSRIKKAQELKTKTFANSDIKDISLEIKLWGRLLASFQEDAGYEHAGQDTRSQDGKDDQDKQGKDLKISK
ncbi:hypothetical protein Tco_0820670 [Tanacetum coccineum]|uniref:Uncharacterized protein n=1 Tax=Tanacetum coccineum TaxID=301880 RepID=A0ABQ5AAZ0_9ASTR